MNKPVVVAIFTPKDTNLNPYIYGVFPTEEQAIEHHDKWGDKDGTLRLSSEHLIIRDNVTDRGAISNAEPENTFQYWQQPSKRTHPFTTEEIASLPAEAQALVNGLGDIWNKYLSIRGSNADQQVQFCEAINTCQDMVLQHLGRKPKGV